MWLGHYAVLKKPSAIICLGDFNDMHSLSFYDSHKKGGEGARYDMDIKAGCSAMERFFAPIYDYNEKARQNHHPLYTPELHLALGNHEYRIMRAIENDPKWEGKISLADLRYEEFGWTVHPFLTPFTVDGVSYCHYFPSGPKQLPISDARKLLTARHMSSIAGHKPGRDIAFSRRGDGTRMTAIISGSFYVHDESYFLGPQDEWRGFWMLHEVFDGGFDEMAVSINYLKRKAKKEGWQ